MSTSGNDDPLQREMRIEDTASHGRGGGSPDPMTCTPAGANTCSGQVEECEWQVEMENV